jgi:hypothetical protein
MGTVMSILGFVLKCPFCIIAHHCHESKANVTFTEGFCNFVFFLKNAVILTNFLLWFNLKEHGYIRSKLPCIRTHPPLKAWESERGK